MTEPLYRAGDFVWCCFPERENPAHPGPLHLAYILAVSDVAAPDFSALLAYTTSRPWPHAAKPLGMFTFDQEEAAPLGQKRAFRLDARRMAYVPLSVAWFPRMDRPPTHGVQGHAPKSLQRRIYDAALKVLAAAPPIVERLGPRWP